MSNPIIAALDVSTADEALALAAEVAPAVGAFKIGKELFVSAGPDIVQRVRDTGAEVFLDLKFHDIPNTVAKAVASAARLDVQLLTVHASGGTAMLRAAQKASGQNGPLVLGVTVLTSMGESDLLNSASANHPPIKSATSPSSPPPPACTGWFVRQWKSPCCVKLAGEIARHPGHPPGRCRCRRQKRVLTPAEALAAGANRLVIGRPIYAAENPRAAAGLFWIA